METISPQPILKESNLFKKLLYISTFFVITPITIFTSLLALSVLSHSSSNSKQVALINSIQQPQYGSRIYASLPDPVGKVAGAATTADARVEIVRQYLERYDSPLEPHAKDVIEISEKYGLDFRLLVAIAQQESNLCKKIPENSFNCWGWGIHSKGTLRFLDYSMALETVAKGLREEYFNKGYTTPEEIMAKYTPSSPGTWAAGVRQFLEEME